MSGQVPACREGHSHSLRAHPPTQLGGGATIHGLLASCDRGGAGLRCRCLRTYASWWSDIWETVLRTLTKTM